MGDKKKTGEGSEPVEDDFARAAKEEMGDISPEPDAGTHKESEDEDGKKQESEEDEGEKKEDEDGGSEESEESEESDEDEGDIPQGTKDRIERRIAKEVAKRKALEDRLDESQEQIRELREKLQGSGKPEGFKAESYGVMSAETADEIDQREEFLLNVEEFCETYKETGYEGEDGYKKSPEELRQKLLNARREMRLVIPKARALLQERQKADAALSKAYPKVLERRSEERVEIDGLVARYPALKLIPEYKLMLADMLSGRKARMDGKKKLPPKAPKQPVSSAPSSKTDHKAKKSAADLFKESNYDEETLARALDE